MSKELAILLAACTPLALLAGCNGQQKTSTSAQDKSNFSGGPMPAEARAKMQERVRYVHPQPGGPPPAAATGN